MKKHTIIAIVGPSGAGKTAISMAMAKAGIPYVSSYTTRPMREGETEGVEHRFINEEDMENIVGWHTAYIIRCNQDLLLAHVPAYTCINSFSYFVTSSQLAEHPIQTYTIDEKGLLLLQRWADTCRSHVSVLTVYIDRDKEQIAKQTDAERMARDNERTALPDDTYTIRIINDSPSLDQLDLWAENFGFALKTVIGSTGVKPCELHTSDARLLHIVNHLNNVHTHA